MRGSFSFHAIIKRNKSFNNLRLQLINTVFVVGSVVFVCDNHGKGAGQDGLDLVQMAVR